MLQSLSIHNIVLIDRLDLTFDEGLCVLTGETGAGKSILLDALGLALGNRADARLVRKNCDRASVIASFDLPLQKSCISLLQEAGVPLEDDLILRRNLNADGRSKAYINDTPVSRTLLKRIGESLLEIQGQFDQRGLMDSNIHCSILDAFGEQEHHTARLSARVKTLAKEWREARRNQENAEEALRQARKEEEFLRHALRELDSLALTKGELEQLSIERQQLLHSEKTVKALHEALAALDGSDGFEGNNSAEDSLFRAQRSLDDAFSTGGEELGPAIEALERAAFELQEAIDQIKHCLGRLADKPNSLATIEERFFLLQDTARKHRCEADDLPFLAEKFRQQLDLIDNSSDNLAVLTETCETAKKTFVEEATSLSQSRRAAAEQMDKAINGELLPLKLERARFTTMIKKIPDEEDWRDEGLDRVTFLVATNPGSAPGPIGKIASGGELGRFLLAIKVVLSKINPGVALVFDEVDAGIGGATAHAVGERLARLAEGQQILVITHSPQVAAKGNQHLLVAKENHGDETLTRVRPLIPSERLEEVARMLSGAKITAEARAAAKSLLKGRGSNA